MAQTNATQQDGRRPARLWLRICGVYNLFFGLVHFAFVYIWRHEAFWGALPQGLSALLDVFNVQMGVLLCLAGYLYLRHGDEIRATRLGRAFAAGMLVFWLARAVDDLLWGVQPLWLAVLGLGAALHAIVVFKSRAR
ncbi:MAG: hypothetical protein AB1714_23120 [Acidobacteriota bacterium]